MASAVRASSSDGLFHRIGAFLAEQGLSPEPPHYAFAYAVLSEPNGTLAREVAEITGGGFRLRRDDLERLGCQIGAAAASAPARAVEPPPAFQRQAEELVAQTQAQVDGFADIVREMKDETHGFGRDLAVSAAQIVDSGPAGGGNLSRLATEMLARVHDSEQRLARATDETDALRAKLAEARDAARRDPLTGLPNRLALAEGFSARPGAGPHCLALCDIDRFKRINDQHGHGVGDRVLGMIGKTLAEAFEGHLVCRYGGEEFAVLLNGVTLAKAAEMLDGARATTSARRLRNRDTDAPIGEITFSAGVVALRTGETAEEAMDRADRLLYTAKAQGRDRVCAG
ncbi:GGDEF domain-containing protein [Sphingomonas sp. KR1UV-12]|uniref:diguanylate cyclase n=1 Tax=Sphingomonas aurea TaxID=3063994 RepID=A0ABT9EL15_9SPHN|nr:GGDEF domain-containing protein [Sphingomonas sp. KR1UV-12]MDP1027662.1 GGDEF domain-containing protein [Sphingomonas sp. KR1UV-12]